MGRRFGLAGLAAAVLAVAVPAGGLAATPVIHGHFNFTSDPYPAFVCGVSVTEVDRVVEQFSQDASGATIDDLNLTSLFTAANGKSVEFHHAGVAKGDAPIDNGDGTLTFVVTVNGISPLIKLPNGPVLAVDVGTITVTFTIVAATEELISFEVVRQEGQRPPGCPLVVAALV